MVIAAVALLLSRHGRHEPGGFGGFLPAEFGAYPTVGEGDTGSFSSPRSSPGAGNTRRAGLPKLIMGANRAKRTK